MGPQLLCDLVRVQVGTLTAPTAPSIPFPLPALGLFLLCKRRETHFTCHLHPHPFLNTSEPVQFPRGLLPNLRWEGRVMGCVPLGPLCLWPFLPHPHPQ